MAEYVSDVLIIGAGLSGLIAAHKLTKQGLSVTLVDKGRSVGGRLATRRFGGGLADHGAQFFTVRSQMFQQSVDQWLADHIVYVWSNGFSDGLKTTDQFDGHPRYATHGGMNALAKYLAKTLSEKASIYTDVKIATIALTADGWEAHDENGSRFSAKAMLMTPPVPQSLVLLGELTGKLTTTDREALERIAYVPCVAGLFHVEGDVNLPEPGVLQRPDNSIGWIGDNQRKGISPNARIITVHSGISVSQKLWEGPEADALEFLRAAFEKYLAAGAVIVEAELKRWRYSQPTVLHPDRYLAADGLPPLYFAGDAFGEARIEGAFLSGTAASEAIVQQLA